MEDLVIEGWEWWCLTVSYIKKQRNAHYSFDKIYVKKKERERIKRRWNKEWLKWRWVKKLVTYKQDEQNVMLLVKDPKTANQYTLQWREFMSYTLLLNCPFLTLYHTTIYFNVIYKNNCVSNFWKKKKVNANAQIKHPLCGITCWGADGNMVMLVYQSIQEMRWWTLSVF